MFIKLLLPLLILAYALPGHAEGPPPLTFGVVPQQSASKLARLWGPLLSRIGELSGHPLQFRTAPDIPEFERRLAAGEYDLAYMNPYHFTVFNRTPGYRAVAHAKGRRIQGIVVVPEESPVQRIEELAGKTLVFPSPAAFAASLLPQGEFKHREIPITPKYVASHDSVYRNVAKGFFPAGGGVMRTLNNIAPEVRDRLRILWRTDHYTPHAIATHPRVEAATRNRLRKVLSTLHDDEQGRRLTAILDIEGWQTADDDAWDDVRALNIKLLDGLISTR